MRKRGERCLTVDSTNQQLEQTVAQNGSTVIKKQNANYFKYISFGTLTVQNTLACLSIRYARTRSGEMFLSSTAVLMSEVVKLIVCLCFLFIEEGNFSKFFNTLHLTIIKQPMDTLKVCVPSLIYIIQHNLLYLSASNLDVVTYQVTCQLKVLTTAFFAVVILRKSLGKLQWTALILLIVGVVLVQLSESDPQEVTSVMEQNRILGVVAALSASFLSGFAGVYCEKILKNSDISLWMRSVQLSFLSLPFGLFTCLLNDGEVIRNQGFFVGFDCFVIYLVVLQACGGLIAAMVVKHGDNILKSFATSSAIKISGIASIYLFNLQMNLQFGLGAALVTCSIIMYGRQSKNLVKDKHSPIEKE